MKKRSEFFSPVTQIPRTISLTLLSFPAYIIMGVPMRFLKLSYLLLPFIAPGCASLPEISETQLTTAAVIHHIKCEIREAAITADPNNSYFNNWGVGNKLTLAADHTGSLTAIAGLRHPLLPQIFELSGTTSLSGQGTKTERIDFHSNINSLRNATQSGCDHRLVDDRHALLGGSLGLEDLFERVVASVDTAKITPKQLDYTVSFVIRKSADATARFTLLPWGGRKTGTLGGTWAGNRTRTHTLVIVLTPPSARRVCLLEFVDDKDKKKFEGVCPEDIVTIGSDGVAKIDPKILKDNPELFSFSQENREPKVKPNVGARNAIQRQEEERRIERALDRSTLQGISEELRNRDVIP